ncbi:MAG TPA: hypothetical protein VGA36_03205 [Nitriliruptorales bacterium]
MSNLPTLLAGASTDPHIVTVRVTTGSIGAAGEANVAVTWPTAFADTDYTVVALVAEDAGGESLRARRVRTLSTTGCVVNVVNNALLSRTGTLHVIAIHD